MGTAGRSSVSSRSCARRPRRSSTRDDLHILLQWGFSAAYSAEEDGTVRLPYDPTTAQVIPELWERWLEWDYPTMIPRHADALRGMRAIYYDAGTRDEWYLDLVLEWIRRELTAHRRAGPAHRALRRDPRGHRVPLPDRPALPRGQASLDVEADVQDVAVLDHVRLPLDALEPLTARVRM